MKNQKLSGNKVEKMLTYNNLLQFYHFLSDNFTNRAFNIKFSYAIQKNMEKIRKVMQPLEKPLIDFEKDVMYLDYKKAVVEINKKHAAKDKNGNILFKDITDEEGNVVNRVPDFINEKKRDKELDELKSKFEGTLLEKEKRENEYKESLEEKVDFEFYTVSLEFVPDISVEDLERLKYIIREE